MSKQENKLITSQPSKRVTEYHIHADGVDFFIPISSVSHLAISRKGGEGYIYNLTIVWGINQSKVLQTGTEQACLDKLRQLKETGEVNHAS